MSRQQLGRTLVALGIVLALIGVVGTVLDRGGDTGTAAAPTPTTAAPTDSTPSASPTGSTPGAEPAATEPSAGDSEPPAAAFAPGTHDDPSADAYDCATGAADDEPRVDIVSLTFDPEATNPATGAAAAALLVVVRTPFRTEDVGAEAVALIGDAPAGSTNPAVDDLHGAAGGTQLRMTYIGTDSEPPFAKSARTWDDGWSEIEPSSYNTRFEGFDDHAEFEFFAPPGTTFGAVLVTDTRRCDLAVAA